MKGVAKMIYQIALLNGMRIHVNGEPLEIDTPVFKGFNFFVYQGIKTWIVCEVITGAKIAEGSTKYEAIGAAVTKLSANGRDILIEKINEFSQQYGRTTDGLSMNLPANAS